VTPPLVSVVIPHYNGVQILDRCLASLSAATYPRLEIIVVDNGSTDGSADFVLRNYPRVRVLGLGVNRGFAGGCNAGISAAAGELVCILNNDTVHEPDWLDHLVRVLVRCKGIAAVQPKIISYQNRKKFDYSGACGGHIDWFGFPFARGRLFDSLENDYGQYDDQAEIFWASGTAFLAWRKELIRAGLFHDWYFAHMEEIDLQWRLHLMGGRILAVPEAVVYHHSGYTLKTGSWSKIYLNHRNSLVMIACNYSIPTLACLLPLRLLLDLAAGVKSLVSGDFKRAAAIPLALAWLVAHPRRLKRARAAAQRVRRVSDAAVMAKMYNRSISLDYYIGGVRRYQQLKSWM